MASLLALAPALALAENWTIDAAHSQTTFSVKHLVISTVRGEFGKTTGTVTLDDADPARSRVEVLFPGDIPGDLERQAIRGVKIKGAVALEHCALCGTEIVE